MYLEKQTYTNPSKTSWKNSQNTQMSLLSDLPIYAARNERETEKIPFRF